MELGAFNIKVSIIEPGPVKTEFFDIAGDRIDLNVPPSKQRLYHGAIQAIKEIEQQTAALAWSSERVAGVIIRALRDRHPRSRYIAATGGTIMLFLMTKVMPRGLVDLFWKRFYRINQVERDWKNRSQSVR
jgi:short-subunit dehydrogenase